MLCARYIRFGRCECADRPYKYTRCVSVAARGVASSLPAPFQLPGASFEVNVIRPLFRSLSRTRATVLTPSPLLPFLCGILCNVPSPICLSLPLSFSLFRLLHLSSFGTFGRVSDERTLKQAYAGTLLCSQIHEVTVIVTKLRSKGCKCRKNKKLLNKIFFYYYKWHI